MKSVNNEELQYIPMTLEHFNDAYTLWEKSEGIILTIGDTKESLSKYLSRNLGVSFVCIDKNSSRLIGTVLGGHDGRRGFIYHLAVDNNYRNKSIGRDLVEKSIEALKSKGIERCIIMVKNGNEEGEMFWKKIGWQKRDDLIMYSVNLNPDSQSK